MENFNPRGNSESSRVELDGDKLTNDSYSEWSKYASTGGLISPVEVLIDEQYEFVENGLKI